MPYFPTFDELDGRNLSNRARAMKAPYEVPARFCTADTRDLLHKFEQRVTPDGCLRCYLCGRALIGAADWHLDHVHPLALGGTHVFENLEPACARCNLSKSDLTLEDFLGPELAAKWRNEGWPPSFDRLSSKPVDELWKMSPAIARRFARSPRSVPENPAAKWGTSEGGDVGIARLLGARPDPWLAVPLQDLWEPLGYQRESSLEQQWDVAMGLAGSPSRPFSHDKRNPDSRLVMPTRYIGPTDSRLVGRKAFRLRFDFTPPGWPNSQRSEALGTQLR